MTDLEVLAAVLVAFGLVVAFLLRRQVESRRPAGRDDPVLPGDCVVLQCRTPAGPWDLAMDTSTVAGFLSWVESAPPGR